MADIVIFGAGGIARLARWYFDRDSEHRVAAFAVDAAFRTCDTYEGLPVIAFEDIVDCYPPDRFKFFAAVSYAKMNQLRAEKYLKAKALGYAVVNYVSSRCTYLSGELPGENCFILEDNTIQPFVRIGNNVTLWSGNHIGHDSVIEDHCFIASHVVVSGNCHIGEYCFIGVNATLRNNLTLAPRTLLGAGAVLMKDSIEGGVYVPETATLIDKRSHEVRL